MNLIKIKKKVDKEIQKIGLKKSNVKYNHQTQEKKISWQKMQWKIVRLCADEYKKSNKMQILGRAN